VDFWLLPSPAIHLKVVNAIVDMKSFGQLLAETSEVQVWSDFFVKSIIASCFAISKLCTNGDMTNLVMSCLKKKVRFHLCVNESRRLCVLRELLQDAPNAPKLDLSVMDVPMVVFEKVCFHYSKCLVVKETYRWNNLELIGMKVVWLVSIVCQRRGKNSQVMFFQLTLR